MKKALIHNIIVLLLILGIGIWAWLSGENVPRKWLPWAIAMTVSVFVSIKTVLAQRNGKRKDLLNSHGELVTKAFTGKGQRSLRRRFEKAVLLYDGNNCVKSRDELLKLEAECTNSIDHAALYYMLGLIYTAMRNETEAIRFYRNSLAHVSENGTAWSNLGIMLSRSGKHTEALECLNKAIEYNPKNCNAHNNLAAVYYRMGEYEKCIASLEKALEINPKLRQAAESMSCAYLQLGNEEKCEEYLNLAISLGSGRKDMTETLDDIRKMKEYGIVVTPAGTTAN